MKTYTIKADGNKCTIVFKADLTATIAAELKKELSGAMEEGIRVMEFDLASVEVLDSSGIGLLVAAHNSLAKKGGEVHIANVSSEIMKLMQSMRLDKRLRVAER